MEIWYYKNFVQNLSNWYRKSLSPFLAVGNGVESRKLAKTQFNNATAPASLDNGNGAYSLLRKERTLSGNGTGESYR